MLLMMLMMLVVVKCSRAAGRGDRRQEVVGGQAEGKGKDARDKG
jgi:hypothetical protein